MSEPIMPPPPTISAEELIQRLERMKGLRNNFDTQFQEIKDLIWPDGGDFITTRSQGEKTNNEIFDSHAALYLEQGASVFEALLTPRTQRWHSLKADKPELMKIARVKEWFENATDVLFGFRNSPRSRFASTAHEHWKSTLGYGNACTFVRDLPTGGTAYRPIHIGNAWIDVDYDGIIDTIFYEYPLTAKAAVQRWREEAPKSAQEAAKIDPSAEHRYLHVVMPNPNYDPMMATPEHMAFVAYEVCIRDKCIIESGGYHEFPYMWSRYTLNPAETYGRGPGMLILPDIKTLQKMERTFLRAGQKAADPPLLAMDDGVLGRRADRRIQLGAGKITPGGVTPDGRPMVMPLHLGSRLDLTYEMIQGRRDLLRRAFHVDFFEILVQDRVEMTATEVLERSREKGLLLGPVIGRQQSEFLGPMIERDLKIAQRQRKLAMLPPELIEAMGEYEIVYESDATRMQKTAEVSALSRALEATLPFWQTNPSRLEIFKMNDTFRHAYETLGGKSSLLRTDDEMREVEEALAAAQQEQAVLDAIPAVTRGARDMAEAGAKRAA